MPWLRWLFASFSVTAPLIFLSHVLRDHPLHYAVSEALVWGGISAWIYTLGRIENTRRGRQCALCVGPSRAEE
ncbi:hypothetical protein AB4059_13635 [Lysobacter sp. 2RAF19]